MKNTQEELRKLVGKLTEPNAKANRDILPDNINPDNFLVRVMLLPRIWDENRNFVYPKGTVEKELFCGELGTRLLLLLTRTIQHGVARKDSPLHIRP